MSDGRATNKCLEWKRQRVERGMATPHPLVLAPPGEKNMNRDSKWVSVTPEGFMPHSGHGKGSLHLLTT